MSVRGRIERLERVLAPRSEPEPEPLLNRHEMAVVVALRIKRKLASNPHKTERPDPAHLRQLSPEERDKIRSFVDLQIKRAKEIEAAGRLPGVLASLRAKGYEA